MGDYLDKTGLTRLWSKIKTYVGNAYTSKAAASGGTAVSLVTTGEKYTWNNKTSNTGTVTSIATGAGLTGGTITGSGTLKADLKSETKSSLVAMSKGAESDREYAVGLDKNGDLSVNVPWTGTPEPISPIYRKLTINYSDNSYSYNSTYGHYYFRFNEEESGKFKSNLFVDSVYTVEFDGVTYTVNGQDGVALYWGVVLGNKYLINTYSQNTGEPFCIFKDYLNYNCYAIVTTSNSSSHTTVVYKDTSCEMIVSNAYDNEWMTTPGVNKKDATYQYEYYIDPLALPCTSIRDGHGGPGSVEEGGGYNFAGPMSHVEGYNVIVEGRYSHGEGVDCYVGADVYCAHVEGDTSSTNGTNSHAEGSRGMITYYGYSGHCEGYENYVDGDSAHAEGRLTRAMGDYCHVEGYDTRAYGKSQHVFGEFNSYNSSVGRSTRDTYVEIVGNGTSTTSRSNARTLDWSGNEVLAGKLTVGAGPTNNMDVATKQYVDNVAGGYESASITLGTNVTGSGTLYKSGRIVILSANLKYSTTGTNITIGSIPSSKSTWKPVAEMFLSCDCYRTGYGISTNEAKINTSGNIVANISAANQELKIFGVWISSS